MLCCRQSLLMAVGIRLRQIGADRFAQMCWRFEPEQAGVADIELDDVSTLPLQLKRATRQLATDFVADLIQAGCGFDLVLHGRHQVVIVAGS